MHLTPINRGRRLPLAVHRRGRTVSGGLRRACLPPHPSTPVIQRLLHYSDDNRLHNPKPLLFNATVAASISTMPCGSWLWRQRRSRCSGERVSSAAIPPLLVCHLSTPCHMDAWIPPPHHQLHACRRSGALTIVAPALGIASVLVPITPRYACRRQESSRGSKR